MANGLLDRQLQTAGEKRSTEVALHNLSPLPQIHHEQQRRLITQVLSSFDIVKGRDPSHGEVA
jgi:hypothetical protein